MTRLATPAVLAAAALLAACGTPQPPAFQYTPPVQQPEIATGTQAKPGWTYAREAVAAANPLATDAGAQVLRAGGSAIDAAIAVQMVLTLVEPQSSGIGGGAFLLHWDGHELQAWDGRETAPAAADERLFLDERGQPLALMQAVVGGRAVGVPGAVRLLALAHRSQGRLPWAQLFEPAIRLAEQGFAISPRLHALLQADPALRRDPLAAAFYYQPDGQALPVGHRLRNPALAAVLRAIAEQGADALHGGPIAADLVRRVQGHATNPGRLSAADLAGYRVLAREPLCTLWRARWRVCGMPPPSSGHLTMMQMLGVLQALEQGAGSPALQPLLQAPPLQQGVPGPEWLHLYAEAARLAYADRARYVGDPAFVSAPGGDWNHLLDEHYLRQRALLVGPRSLGEAPPGVPEALRLLGAAAPVLGTQPAQPEHGTSHISVVDGLGHALAKTTTVESAFGARLLSDGGTGLPGGFVLNNQLTDFAFSPADAQGRPLANRVQPGKRPRSSMSPTLVFDAASGELVMSLGSPGGAVIPHFTAKTLIASWQWGLAPQDAVALPNFGSVNGPLTLLEAGRFPAATLQALRERGHQVLATDLTSGVQVLQRVPDGWLGAADPRREGVVRGD
jgi:gamma-glutamyltranspeptidase/glutathione hydrolase